jgi:hypothetical protein
MNSVPGRQCRQAVGFGGGFIQQVATVASSR